MLLTNDAVFGQLASKEIKKLISKLEKKFVSIEPIVQLLLKHGLPLSNTEARLALLGRMSVETENKFIKYFEDTLEIDYPSTNTIPLIAVLRYFEYNTNNKELAKLIASVPTYENSELDDLDELELVDRDRSVDQASDSSQFLKLKKELTKLSDELNADTALPIKRKIKADLFKAVRKLSGCGLNITFDEALRSLQGADCRKTKDKFLNFFAAYLNILPGNFQLLLKQLEDNNVTLLAAALTLVGFTANSKQLINLMENVDVKVPLLREVRSVEDEEDDEYEDDDEYVKDDEYEEDDEYEYVKRGREGGNQETCANKATI